MDPVRRRLLKMTASGVAVSVFPNALSRGALSAAEVNNQFVLIDDFKRADSTFHGPGWETFNPGYWKVENDALRRRLKNYGDRPGDPAFPYHHSKEHPWQVDYDPSLPNAMIYRNDWKLTGNYGLHIDAAVMAERLAPTDGEDPSWKMYTSGYSLLGLCFGACSLFESSGIGGVAKIAGWLDDGRFGLFQSEGICTPTEGYVMPAVSHGGFGQEPLGDTTVRTAPQLKAGDKFAIDLHVSGEEKDTCDVSARLTCAGGVVEAKVTGLARSEVEGYVGIVTRGLVDFEVRRFELMPGANEPLSITLNECHVCYALGDTLREEDGQWRVRFMAIFRSAGEVAEIRLSDKAIPESGWAQVPVSAKAAIVSNNFRLNTAVLDAVLPSNPAECEHYFTIWKDGTDVTADPRLGTDACGIGTGLVGNTPVSGVYVGRLPQLTAPYRISAHGCHFTGSNDGVLPEWQEGGGWQISDQPNPDGHRHFEKQCFQVAVWDDDVYYLEEWFRPASIDDAFKTVTLSIAGPTTRWQMMRHWNVLNPGDHDYGMDDIEGPEQVAMRRRDDLGGDPDYLIRNVQMTVHLMTGDENPPATDNPRLWRRWKMPNRDFSLVIVDSRLWRSSFDTRLWTDLGWGDKVNVFDRHSPNRTVLGEEQYSWLDEIIKTDSSRLICVTGIVAMNAVWTGRPRDDHTTMETPGVKSLANYVGWHAVPASRLLRLFGSREGIVSIYGDVHTACLMQNVAERLYECSFGPYGPYGGRQPKPGFGRRMIDYNGEEVEVIALYHDLYGSPDLGAASGPKYWNILDMTFDTLRQEPWFGIKIRNVIDGPKELARGGGEISALVSQTGRKPISSLPAIKTLANADVMFHLETGMPVRAVRSLDDGTVPLKGLTTVAPGTRLVMTAYDGVRTDSRIIRLR